MLKIVESIKDHFMDLDSEYIPAKVYGVGALGAAAVAGIVELTANNNEATHGTLGIAAGCLLLSGISGVAEAFQNRRL